ncbi:Anaphase-promoting complex subunit 5 [Lobaria immixta]|nr:Anaphase-promoting complex subunit 5 [Lobaria immixta]
MSRYLTPSKVGLLALISLYTDSVVPSTATIPVLSFLVSHLLPIESLGVADEVVSSHCDFTITVDSFRKATIILASGIPGRTIWDLLLKKLWEISSFDALHCFFDTLPFILEKTAEESQNADGDRAANSKLILLSRVSPLGAFVRRAQLEFTRLQFHDGIVFWKNFVSYRASTLQLWKRRNPAAGRSSFDSNLHEHRLGMDDRLTELVYGDITWDARKQPGVSTDDIEKLLEYQVDKMQKMGNRLPPLMKDQFRKMTKSGVTIPSLSHYLQFLDSWKAGDYTSSFDNLHRYFDYTMHNRDRTFYQYALLNLAILQADFGCYSDSIIAMEETISTARENNDMGCLNYSLSWLYHFSKAHPKDMGEVQKKGVLGADKDALAFLKAKAKETNMWSLLSTSLLSEAKLALSNGENVSHAFECLLKASHLNVTKNVVNAIGSQMMMQSSIYGRLGVTCQSWLSGELFLRCYANQSPIEDVMHCVCKSAYLLAQRGRYYEALDRMNEVDQESLRTLKYYQYWTAYLGMLKLQRHLHKDNLVAAEHILSQIHTIPFLGQDLLFTVVTLEIDLHVRRRDFSKAMSILENLASKLNDEEADVAQRIKIMTLKARIFDRAGIPQKGFSVALRAANLAHRALLLPGLWEAVGVVGRILISIKEYAAAARLLESIMPQVLECEDCDLAGGIFRFLADAHMGMAGQAKTGTLQRKEGLTKALECLDRSFDQFSRIEDIKGQYEMMAKKATIMHLNGDLVLANDCAAKYLDIKQAAKEHF